MEQNNNFWTDIVTIITKTRLLKYIEILQPKKTKNQKEKKYIWLWVRRGGSS